MSSDGEARQDFSTSPYVICTLSSPPTIAVTPVELFTGTLHHPALTTPLPTSQDQGPLHHACQVCLPSSRSSTIEFSLTAACGAISFYTSLPGSRSRIRRFGSFPSMNPFPRIVHSSFTTSGLFFSLCTSELRVFNFENEAALSTSSEEEEADGDICDEARQIDPVTRIAPWGSATSRFHHMCPLDSLRERNKFVSLEGESGASTSSSQDILLHDLRKHSARRDSSTIIHVHQDHEDHRRYVTVCGVPFGGSGGLIAAAGSSRWLPTVDFYDSRISSRSEMLAPCSLVVKEESRIGTVPIRHVTWVGESKVLTAGPAGGVRLWDLRSPEHAILDCIVRTSPIGDPRSIVQFVEEGEDDSTISRRAILRTPWLELVGDDRKRGRGPRETISDLRWWEGLGRGTVFMASRHSGLIWDGWGESEEMRVRECIHSMSCDSLSLLVPEDSWGWIPQEGSGSVDSLEERVAAIVELVQSFGDFQIRFPDGTRMQCFRSLLLDSPHRELILKKKFVRIVWDLPNVSEEELIKFLLCSKLGLNGRDEDEDDEEDGVMFCIPKLPPTSLLDYFILMFELQSRSSLYCILQQVESLKNFDLLLEMFVEARSRIASLLESQQSRLKKASSGHRDRWEENVFICSVMNGLCRKRRKLRRFLSSARGAFDEELLDLLATHVKTRIPFRHHPMFDSPLARPIRPGEIHESIKSLFRDPPENAGNVTVAVHGEGEALHVRKIHIEIACARLRFFSTLVRFGGQEASEMRRGEVVVLDEIVSSPQLLDAILEFAYCAEVDSLNTLPMFLPLLQFAEMFAESDFVDVLLARMRSFSESYAEDTQKLKIQILDCGSELVKLEESTQGRVLQIWGDLIGEDVVLRIVKMSAQSTYAGE